MQNGGEETEAVIAEPCGGRGTLETTLPPENKEVIPEGRGGAVNMDSDSGSWEAHLTELL